MDQNHLRPSSPLLIASTETASIKRIGEQEYEFHQQHEQLLSLDSLNYLKLYSLVFPTAACYITSTYWDCYKNGSKSISQVLQVLGKSVLIQPFIWILMLSDSCEEIKKTRVTEWPVSLKVSYFSGTGPEHAAMWMQRKELWCRCKSPEDSQQVWFEDQILHKELNNLGRVKRTLQHSVLLCLKCVY